MDICFIDKKLESIYAKVLKKSRLSREDGICLFKTDDIIGLGKIANYVKTSLHKNKVYYICNQHINYTNVCKNKCLFCAYARDINEKGSYTMSINEIEQVLLNHIDKSIDELHIVGGLNENLTFEYFIDLLKTAKRIRPKAFIKAFTCVEIDYLSSISKLSIEQVIIRLKEAGLDMMPGGGAEILNSRVHNQLFKKKINCDSWIEITRLVHKHGIKTNATILYGHIETIEERVDHLIKLRELQDETLGFLAFVPLAFHPENTELSDVLPSTAVDDLKNIAVARLILDNFDHIKAYWVMITEALAQIALSFGADDLDGTIVEEKITHFAGAKSARGLSEKQLKRLITNAGFKPVKRDSFYNQVSS